MSSGRPGPTPSDSTGQPLDLAGFRDAPDDQGMTLDNLHSAFAELLGQGEEPYESPAEPAAGEVGPAIAPDAAPESDGDDACEVTPRTILEAMLFVGNPDGSPLSAARVAALMRGVRAAEIESFVAELNEQYAANRCPFRIVPEAEGYRLALLPAYEEVRNAVHGQALGRRLSPAAVEVLSIVAYKGPLTGEAVSRLRGRPSGSILAQLVRRQLLRIERKAARPWKYMVADRLLKLAGLASLEDLPRPQDLDLN